MLILFPTLKRWGLPQIRGYVAKLRNCVLALILPLFWSVGHSLDGGDYVAKLPSCGQMAILFPARKCLYPLNGGVMKPSYPLEG